MSTVSACLVVHHEEERVIGCLESCADLVDEIVVVHDGPCRDATLSVARRFTDKVFCTETRAGSSELIRAFALERCTKEWVLVIDADERLSPGLRVAFRSLVVAPGVDAYGFAWPYVDATGRSVARTSVSGKRFLFRRASMYTVGLPHMPTDTYGTSVGTSLEVHHLLPEGRGRAVFRNVWRKNRRRARAAAAVLADGAGRVATFNASLSDARVKNTRKIRLLTRHPLLALLVVPSYGFLNAYFGQGYWREGWIGVHDALNLPIYYAWLAFYLLSRRFGRAIPPAVAASDDAARERSARSLGRSRPPWR